MIDIYSKENKKSVQISMRMSLSVMHDVTTTAMEHSIKPPK